MPWIEFHITTSAEKAEQLGDELHERNAVAISFLDAADDPIYEPNPLEVELWKNTVVVALYEANTQLHSIHSFFEDQQAQGLIQQFQIKHLDDQDWERICLDHFQPIRFGKRLWICPSWHTPPDNDGINVHLDPGLAFGTGSHPTTALCLEWLDAHITSADKLVVDYGCGSGILGIAALKLGAHSVLAIDNDPQALEATVANGERNLFSAPKLTAKLPFVDSQKLQADVIIANILAQPLLHLAPFLAEMVKKGGKIVLSGILENQAESVKNAYLTWFKMQQPVLKEGWILLEGNKL